MHIKLLLITFISTENKQMELRNLIPIFYPFQTNIDSRSIFPNWLPPPHPFPDIVCVHQLLGNIPIPAKSCDKINFIAQNMPTVGYPSWTHIKPANPLPTNPGWKVYPVFQNRTSGADLREFYCFDVVKFSFSWEKGLVGFPGPCLPLYRVTSAVFWCCLLH